ncbi:hypothetical protein H9L39_12920 [Fusarium oxysporum f. sp. albedinis]|nr:hypothetical protein H9L39_12920 [Fusarium oxysporum f. sp. albedinis]
MRGRLIPGLPGQGSKGRVGTFTDLSPFDQYDQGPANHTDAITMCHVSSTIDRDVAVVIRNARSRVVRCVANPGGWAGWHQLL